jgi:alpha-tubulin suppressor-like RCC1 family protein
MTTNFRINGTDFDDVFVRKDLFSEGGMWLWGTNSFGELGTNDRTTRSSPVQTVSGGTNWKQVSAGRSHTAAIKTDGTLWLWGRNASGQIGNNNNIGQSSPVQTVSGGTNWKQVSMGYHTGAIKTDGTLWMWGRNASGQLGNNGTAERSSPVQTVSEGTNWKQVSCGYHTAAIKTDGTLWLWGNNINGQLGDNTATNKSSPVQTVSAGTNWKQISAGYRHSAAIKTDGTLWLWGRNNNGQLGDNTTTDRSSPVQTVSGGTNWKQVSVNLFGNNGHMSAAIKTDGTLWLWGTNTLGQLGTNDITNRSSPVQTVAGGTNWKQVAVGYRNSVSIKTDGTLWIWGIGSSGELGDNTIVDKSSPVQTVSGGTNWKQVSAGNSNIAAIRDDYWA